MYPYLLKVKFTLPDDKIAPHFPHTFGLCCTKLVCGAFVKRIKFVLSFRRISAQALVYFTKDKNPILKSVQSPTKANPEQ